MRRADATVGSLANTLAQRSPEKTSTQKFSSAQQLSPLLLSKFDFDWLVKQPLLPFLVQAVAPRKLWEIVKQQGLEDSLEVVTWIRGRQLRAVFDFAIWGYSAESHSQDVSAQAFLEWLGAWNAIDPDFAAHRVFELDEESLVLLFSQLFTIFPEGIAQIDDVVRENYGVTRDKRFFLRPNTENLEDVEKLEGLIESLYALDATFAASILSYASMLVRSETLEDALRWREGRLADQGFVSFEDAQQVLAFRGSQTLKNAARDAQKAEAQRARFFSHDVAQSESADVQERIADLLSSLQPDERPLIFQALLATGVEDHAPEEYDQIVPKIELACRSVFVAAEKCALALPAAETSGLLLVEKVFAVLTGAEASVAFALKTRVATLANTVAIGVGQGDRGAAFLRESETVRALTIVRGALNLGLEECLANAEEYHLIQDKQQSENEKEDQQVVRGVKCLRSFGPEFLFQVGWNILLDLSRQTAAELVRLDTLHADYRGTLNTSLVVTLAGGEPLRLSLDRLVASHRVGDIDVWLSQCEGFLPDEACLVLRALFACPPRFPLILADEGSSPAPRVSQQTKPIECLGEVETLRRFIDNFAYQLSETKG